jgi:hypothetical protein
VAGLVERHRTQRDERLQVRGDGAAGRKIASGRRQARRAAPREQRAQQQDRSAQAADEHRIGSVAVHLDALDAQMPGAATFDTRPERLDQIEQHVDVANSRYVGQLAGRARQHARGNQRQRRVLVPLDRQPP